MASTTLKKETKIKITIVFAATMIAILVSFLAAEVYIRSMGSEDIDGNFFLGYRWLKPYYLPVKTIESKTENILSQPNFIIVRDPDTGWALRPSTVSGDGFYKADKYGIRTGGGDASMERIPGKLRIALIGDSFTYSYDVPFEHTWGYLLEKRLKESGIDAEVINFGVVAYGVDQIYWRWNKLVKGFKPDIVLFGFFYDEFCRDVLMLYQTRIADAGIIFPKPRYILENGDLKIINHPTMTPDETIEYVRNFRTSALAKYEEYYYAPDFEVKLWQKSRALSFLEFSFFRDWCKLKNKTVGNVTPMCYDMGTEPVEIGLKVLDMLEKDVRRQGAEFIVVRHIYRRFVKMLLAGETLPYQPLLDEVKGKYKTIDPVDALVRSAREDSVYSLYVGHYSFKANKIVADEVAAELMKTIKKQ